MSYKVVFYQTKGGRSPAYEFIISQPARMKAKIEGVLKILEEKGPAVREPYSRGLGDGLFELRCALGNDSIRVIYFFHQGKVVVLTNGFVKKSAKTPRRQITIAREYRADYLTRRGGDL